MYFLLFFFVWEGVGVNARGNFFTFLKILIDFYVLMPSIFLEI